MAQTAFIFPGQGSQYANMGRDFYDNFSEARQVFEEVDDALHQKLSDIIFNDDESELALTYNVQPAIMVVCIAIMQVLQKQAGFDCLNKIDFLAGHSLGEYCALHTAGVFNLADVAKLLRVRGQSMQDACELGKGGMVAVVAIEDMAVIDSIIAEASSVGVIGVANDNAPGQIVLTGEVAAIDFAESLAKQAGAKKYIRLNVSAAFHSPLVEKAKQPMADALDMAKINPLQIPVLSNVTAEKYADDAVKQLLLQQITSRVRWVETINNMLENGVTNFVEIGPGKVLSGLVKRIVKKSKKIAKQTDANNINITNIETIADLEKFLSS